MSWLPDMNCSPSGILYPIAMWETSVSWLPSRNLLIQFHPPGQLPLRFNQVWQSPQWKALCVFSWGCQPPGILLGDERVGVTFWILFLCNTGCKNKVGRWWFAQNAGFKTSLPQKPWRRNQDKTATLPSGPTASYLPSPFYSVSPSLNEAVGLEPWLEIVFYRAFEFHSGTSGTNWSRGLGETEKAGFRVSYPCINLRNS